MYVLAIMICVTCLLSSVTVQAATEPQTVFEEKGGVLSSTGDTYTFTTAAKRNFYLEVGVIDPTVSVNVVVTPLDGGKSISSQITSYDWKQDSNITSVYYDVLWTTVPAGNYQVKISADNTSSYYYAIGWLEAAVNISATSLSLSVGQSKTISVSGTAQRVEWSSNKIYVATVDRNGKVTAKKPGKATITAKVGDQIYTCSVTVKKPVINTKSFTITAGQKRTLKVTNKTGKITWKTSKKSVATVSGEGVVTAKKAGKATITASVDGCKLTCKVKVKKNEYRASAVKNSQATYGVWWNPVKVSYNKKGQLVCKVQVVNNSIYHITALDKFTIIVYDKNGVVVGRHTISSKSVSVSSGNNSTITVIIPKSKVKKNNVDLRLAQKPHCEGKYLYKR